MSRWSVYIFFIAVCLFAFPQRSPAPLVFRPGEGWIYEPVGGGKWVRGRAKDQLEVAQEAFDNKDYRTAMAAARRTVRQWPLSDYAPQAQYLVARCYEARGQDERAFKAYQRLIETYPKLENYDEVLERQHEIAGRFLAGQWFKLFGYIPFFPSMEKTADMYAKVIKNGPYSDIAASAQMNIGAAREKQSDFPSAVRAYETAADRYHDRKEVAADAIFKAGMAYNKQARTAEYDQNIAEQAIATLTDFITLFPGDARVAEAQKVIASLRAEQARGSFKIAKFYESKKKWDGALVYYNEVLVKNPDSELAQEARERIDRLKKRTEETVQQ